MMFLPSPRGASAHGGKDTRRLPLLGFGRGGGHGAVGKKRARKEPNSFDALPTVDGDGACRILAGNWRLPPAVRSAPWTAALSEGMATR